MANTVSAISLSKTLKKHLPNTRKDRNNRKIALKKETRTTQNKSRLRMVINVCRWVTFPLGDNKVIDYFKTPLIPQNSI